MKSEEFFTAMVFLGLSFFITALLYAAVGFGGGSTYNALLVLAQTDYRILPALSLTCNVIVVTGGVYRFAQAGHLNLKRIAPWILASVPAAWLGGSIHVPADIFILLLGISLLASGLQMLAQNQMDQTHLPNILDRHKFLSWLMGAILGFLAGLVGIGGGIFLAPLLHLLRWDNAKVIAGTCSFFILVNSLSGLTGQIMKMNDQKILSQLGEYSALFLAVFIGGQIGSYMAATRINAKILRTLTAVLVLYVAARLLLRWWNSAV